MQLGEEIGRGVRSVVYALADGEALKVPNSDVPSQWIVEELRLSDAAARAAAPVPGGRRLVEVDGVPSLASERIDGPSMWQRVLDDPESCGPLAHRLAVVQLRLAGLSASFELPAQRDRIAAKVRVAAERFGSDLDAALDLLPDDDGPLVLCHGDLHPRNVLFDDGGSEVVVDWFDASRGRLVADVARTLVVLDDTFEVSIDTAPTLGRAIEVFRGQYLRAVSELMGFVADDLEPWLLVQRVARLAEGLGGHLVDDVRRRLAGVT